MTKYIVTLESYDGDCKRETVWAASPSDAMARAHRAGWMPVDVEEA